MLDRRRASVVHPSLLPSVCYVHALGKLEHRAIVAPEPIVVQVLSGEGSLYGKEGGEVVGDVVALGAGLPI